MPLVYGVIGSPTGSGPVSLGSSPGTPAVRLPGEGAARTVYVRACSCGRIAARSPVGLTDGEAVVCTALATPVPSTAPSSRGLGRRPLKAVTPVRIRSGLHIM